MEVAGTSWAGPCIDLNPSENSLVDRMYYAIYFREDGTFQFTYYLEYDEAMNHHSQHFQPQVERRFNDSRHFQPQVERDMKSDPSITPEQVYAKYKWKQDGNLVQLSFNDGARIWEGSIDNGVMSGSDRNYSDREGTFSLENVNSTYTRVVRYKGVRYKGDIVAGKPHGQGTAQYDDGRCVDGEFKHGVPHGQGTLTSSRGILAEWKFVGMFKEGKMHGPWTHYTYGRRKEMEYTDGNLNGQELHYICSDINSPDKVDSLLSSQEWKDDKRNGWFRVYLWKEGELILEQEYRDDKKIGPATHYVDGKVIGTGEE